MSPAAHTLFDFVTPAQRDRVLGLCGLSHRLPRHVYSDPGFLRLEYEGWLARTWLMVGRAHEIPEAGDAMPVPGHPIFLIRDVNGEIRAFYNSCRHRGHELIGEPCNRARGIVCPYHHWVYRTTGELRTATHFGGYREHGHPELDRDAFGLKAIRTGVWHNWILVNLDGEAPALEEFVRPLADYYRDVAFPMPATSPLSAATPSPPTGRRSPRTTSSPTTCRWCIPARPPAIPSTATASSTKGRWSAARWTSRAPPSPTGRPPPPPITSTAAAASFSGCPTSTSPRTRRTSWSTPSSFRTGRIPRKCWVSHACYTTSGPGANDDGLERWAAIQETVMEEDAAVMEGVVRGFRAPVMDDGGVISPAWEQCVSGFYRSLLGALENGERA